MTAPLSTEILPHASLIICTRNRDELLVDTIQSIFNAEHIPSEIIIVDQSDHSSSSYNKLERSSGCEIRYAWIKEIGSSHARNYGIAQAKYDILVFLDDDMLVTPKWYQVLIQVLVKNGLKSVVTGRIEPAPGDKPHGFVIAVHTWKESKVYEGRIGMDILASGLMAMYRSAYQETGGFDEGLGPGTRFPGAEDNDFGFRLLEAGYKIIYTADCVVYHRAWRNKQDYVPLFWSYGRGQGAFYAKHSSRNERYLLKRLRQDISRFLKLLLGRLFKRHLLVALGSIAFVFGEISGFLEWWILHRKNRYD